MPDQSMHPSFVAPLRCCFISERPLLDSIGVGYLVAVLKQNGYAVEWFLDKYGFMPWRKQNLTRYDNKELETFFKHQSFDVVFISTGTDYYHRALNIAETLKRKYPALIICMGGPHPTFAHAHVLKNQHVDFACRGEGEIAIIGLLKCLQGECDRLPAGIYTRSGNTLHGEGLGELVTDLDTLPFPEKEACFKALPHIRELYTIASGRGCYNNCTYCNSPTIRKYYRNENKNFLRRRSVENIIAELRLAKEKFGIRLVGFCDDTFIYNREYMRRFAEQYATEIGLPFGCQTNPNFFDREILQMLVDAGMVWVQTGAESLDEHVRRDIFHRKESREDIFRFVRLMQELKVYVRVDQIITPWDNRKSLQQQVRLYNKMRPSWVNQNYLIYYPETEIVDKAIASGHLEKSYRDRVYEGTIPIIMYYGGHMPADALREIKDISLLLNWVTVLPAPVVSFLLMKNRSRFLRWFPVRLTTLTARVINGILGGKGDYVARFHFRKIIMENLMAWPGKIKRKIEG